MVSNKQNFHKEDVMRRIEDVIDEMAEQITEELYEQTFSTREEEDEIECRDYNDYEGYEGYY